MTSRTSGQIETTCVVLDAERYECMRERILCSSSIWVETPERDDLSERGSAGLPLRCSNRFSAKPARAEAKHDDREKRMKRGGTEKIHDGRGRWSLVAWDQSSTSVSAGRFHPPEWGTADTNKVIKVGAHPAGDSMAGGTVQAGEQVGLAVEDPTCTSSASRTRLTCPVSVVPRKSVRWKPWKGRRLVGCVGANPRIRLPRAKRVCSTTGRHPSAPPGTVHYPGYTSTLSPSRELWMIRLRRANGTMKSCQTT